MQIGAVADRTGLSLRTIRYYEEVGLVVPSARSRGGFRLYTEPDIDRFQVIKRMKPLGFQLEEMRELLTLLDGLSAAKDDDKHLDRLAQFHTTAEERCEELRAQLCIAEDFAATLRPPPPRLNTSNRGQFFLPSHSHVT
ncbi:MerR family transcriptional regulator [Actinosynnema sp. NPDC023658]|uniref:MerR family transcriptional regulator n=1 Tax=Actinosynnema sp. NPDC023658 TaxID=3155465 RepID=UPI00340F4313